MKRKWTTVDFTLIVVVAAIYAAALIAFSAIKLGAGISLRPANALQPVFGILFGVPGAIGIALGNFVNDIYTGFFSKSFAGLIGNFLGAYIPYLIVSNPRLRTGKSIAEYAIGVVGITSAVVAGSVLINVALSLTAWPLAKNVLIPLIFGQQVVATAVLGPILLNLLYPFVKRAGLYRGRAKDETEGQEAA
ncbi:MAG: QueT transporter family protein [Bacillota bacterium]